MVNKTLHADHIDTTGAYGKRFEVVKQLIDSGTLTEIPEEFRVNDTVETTTEVVAVVENEKFNFSDKDGNRHADHVDETGEYRRAWEAQFGALNNTTEEEVETPASVEWKSFLQQLITEEKNKLNT